MKQTIANKIDATWAHFIRVDSWKAEPLYSCVVMLIQQASTTGYRKWKCEKTNQYFTTEGIIKEKAAHVGSSLLDYSCEYFLAARLTVHQR